MRALEHLEGGELAPDATAFETYRYVRERVIRMRRLVNAGEPRESSEDQAKTSTALSQMLDASPSVVARLRHQSHQVGGAPFQDYSSAESDILRIPAMKLKELIDCPDDRVQRQTLKLKALMALDGNGLLVPESPLLGGFGWNVEGVLCNPDTLLYYEALIALNEAAVLPAFRNEDQRRVVWQIEGGWGGFAYQFKSLFPNVTYVLTDRPEHFLFSAVYLLTAFPGARVAFYGDDRLGHRSDDWHDFDFVFLPSEQSNLLPDRVDLALSITSFDSMPSNVIRALVQRAFHSHCLFIYSLVGNAHRQADRFSQIRSVIAEAYWPHHVPLLSFAYAKGLSKVFNDRDMSDAFQYLKLASLGTSTNSREDQRALETCGVNTGSGNQSRAVTPRSALERKREREKEREREREKEKERKKERERDVGWSHGHIVGWRRVFV